MTFVREILKSDNLYVASGSEPTAPPTPQAKEKFWARQCFQVNLDFLDEAQFSTRADQHSSLPLPNSTAAACRFKRPDE